MKIRFFRTPADFRKWLEKHHRAGRELWVGYYKTSSGKASMTWPETQPASYQRAVNWWVVSARQEATRLKRLKRLTEESARGKRIAQFTRRKAAPVRT
jgi:uncharacterized protein YdeI (YjbR/CyaY-like superfamily)